MTGLIGLIPNRLKKHHGHLLESWCSYFALHGCGVWQISENSARGSVAIESIPQNDHVPTMQVFDIKPERCLRVSAKTGLGLDEVLPAVIEGIPPPSGNERGPLRMLLFDAVHDEYR